MNSTRLIPFAYTNGPSGFVPAPALRHFKAKDENVQLALTNKADNAIVQRAAGRIVAANRAIARNGWHFFSSEQATNLVASGRYAF